MSEALGGTQTPGAQVITQGPICWGSDRLSLRMFFLLPSILVGIGLVMLQYKQPQISWSLWLVLNQNWPRRPGLEGVTNKNWGNWVARLVKCLTLGFGSGHGLTDCGTKPHVRLCADREEPAWDSLSSSLSAPLTLSLSKLNK